MSPRTTIPLLAATALLSLPAVASASADRNHDGLPDGWETRHHLSLKVNQSNRDADHDGLTNKGERRHGTDPRKADTDRDGMKDGDRPEPLAFLRPLVVRLAAGRREVFRAARTEPRGRRTVFALGAMAAPGFDCSGRCP